mmetsp:Transcript_40453/g.101811  ORF Transcript_40453/g.101811 Transcript_40453/m.101811 type:complete len:695 (-) Transcript_40453:70-2154(-)
MRLNHKRALKWAFTVTVILAYVLYYDDFECWVKGVDESSEENVADVAQVDLTTVRAATELGDGDVLPPEHHWLDTLEGIVLWYFWRIFLPLWAFSQLKRFLRRVRSHTVLELDLNQLKIVPEYDVSNPMADFLHRLSEAMTVRELVTLVDRAAEDSRVVGLVARVGGIPAGALSLTDVEELSAAVGRFRAAGKLTVAYASSFGEFSSHMLDYLLATAFEEVCLQPSGDVTIPGMYAQSFFVRSALDKLDIEPEFHQRHEYKNAANIFTHTEFTDAHREATGAVFRALFESTVHTIAHNRALSVEQVRQAMNSANHSSGQALDRHLIDHVMYADEVWERIRQRVSQEVKPSWWEWILRQSPHASFLYVQKYRERIPRQSPDEYSTKIAVVCADGPIGSGKSQSSSMGSDTVCAALKSALEDKSVQGVIFRVNSPGGGYYASDSIRRMVAKVRQAKPIVVNMRQVAASGGYLISLDASKIVCHPTTITGSIGVVVGKLYMREFLARLGITFDEILFSDHANFFSMIHKHTEEDSALMDGVLDRIYKEFVQMAATARHMEYAELESVARGRVWAGNDALELNLVDEVGDFHTAVRVCKQEIGVPLTEEVSLVTYPYRYTWDQLKNVLIGGAENSEANSSPWSAVRLLLTWSVLHLTESLGLRTPVGLLLTRFFKMATQQNAGIHAEISSNYDPSYSF